MAYFKGRIVHPQLWPDDLDYKDKNVVVRTGCTDFAPVDKSIAQTRIWEKKFKLNTAK